MSATSPEKSSIIRFDRIPPELRALPRWTLFATLDDKQPRQTNGRKADVSDPSTWTTFHDASQLVREGKFAGLNFILSESDDYVAIDLDDVPKNGKWTDEQRSHLPDSFPDPVTIVRRFGSYTERSPSGSGLRIFVRGSLPDGRGRKVGDFEIYDRSKSMSVTGSRLRGHTDIRDAQTAQTAIDWIVGLLPVRVDADDSLDWDVVEHPLGISDEKIIRTMIADDRFRDRRTIERLWNGDWKNDYDSQSDADLALVNHVGYFVGPYPAVVDRLFRRSGLAREKWGRGDYRTSTLTQALATKTDFYLWPPQLPPAPVAASKADDATIPDDLQNVPGFVGDVRRYTLSTAHYGQPLLSLASAMGLFGTLLGNRVSCEQRIYTNVLFVMIAPTGTGKNRPREVNAEILTATQSAHFLACTNPASGPALLRAMESNPVQLVQIDEFGRFLSMARDPRSNAFGIVSEILTLGTSQGSIVTKPYADTKKTFKVVGPLLVLLGATTPDAFFHAVSDSSLVDGLLPRLDLFVGDEDPDPSGFRSFTTLPTDIVERAEAYLRIGPDSPLDLATTPRRLAYSVDARNAWSEYQRFCTRRSRRQTKDAAIWTRSARKAGSFAILHTMSRDPDAGTIDHAAVTWAVELQRRLTTFSGQYLTRWCSDNPFDAKQKALLRKLGRRGWIGQNALTRASQHLRPRERDEILTNLLDTGQLVEVAVPTPKRPATVFIDPSVTTAEKAGAEYQTYLSRNKRNKP